MANYATNDDLNALLPSIFDHGVSDFDDELANATADVNRQIEIEWYNRDFQKGTNRLRFDAGLLDAAQWKRATIYRALSAYILPRLSPFRENDSFQLQMVHYRERYAEEMAAEMAVGVRYDADDSGSVDDTEHFEAPQDRLYR
jgi:hypothetical protein